MSQTASMGLLPMPEKLMPAEARERGGTLASNTYRILREEILTGSLRPGAKLNIRQLGARFTIGLSPLREALNRLSAERLVHQKDNHGFIVTPVSLAELHDLTAARCWANEIGIREAIKRGDDQWEEAVLVSFHRVKRAKRTVNGTMARNPRWDAAHREFHRALISGCGSHWHIETCERLFDAAERYRHLARLAGVTRSSDNEEEHQAIMEAALDRRAESAIGLLNRHFADTARLVERVIER